MKKIALRLRTFLPTIIIMFMFVRGVSFINSNLSETGQYADFVKHLLLIGFLLLGVLICTKIPFPLNNNLLKYIRITELNLTAIIPFIIMFSLIITNDGMFPEFNFVMALFLCYVAYIFYVLISSRKISFKNSYLDRFKIILFNFGIFILLVFLGNTSDDRGEFSTRIQFEILTFLFVGKIILQWFFDQWKHMQKLKNEKVQTELMHLKNQINPHFFFNTLNNLYGLAIEKSDLTQEIIYKLSQMMRFIHLIFFFNFCLCLKSHPMSYNRSHTLV